MTRSTATSLTVVLFFSLLVYGCGGSSSSGGGTFTSLTGNWAGTWKNDGLGTGSPNQGVNNSGLIQALLEEDPPGTVSGTATWTGFSCFLTATVTGIASGSGVSLTFVAVPQNEGDDPVRVTFVAQRNNNINLSGRWDNDTGCFGQGELNLGRG